MLLLIIGFITFVPCTVLGYWLANTPNKSLKMTVWFVVWAGMLVPCLCAALDWHYQITGAFALGGVWLWLAIGGAWWGASSIDYGEIWRL